MASKKNNLTKGFITCAVDYKCVSIKVPFLPSNNKQYLKCKQS